MNPFPFQTLVRNTGGPEMPLLFSELHRALSLFLSFFKTNQPLAPHMHTPFAEFITS